MVEKGGKPDGEIVYIVTYWVNIDNNQTMAKCYKTPNALIVVFCLELLI